MSDRLIHRTEALKMLSISDSTERRLRQAGKMPPPITLGNRVYYRLSSVEQWLTDLEGGR